MGGKNSLIHGHVTSNSDRPKSKQWKRNNKEKARVRASARHEALKAALKRGN